MTAVAQPGSGNGLPYGEPGVGAEAPPPPLNALGNDVAGLRREVGILSQAILDLQDRQTGRQSPAKRRELPAVFRRLPNRSVAVLCAGGAIVATIIGINRYTPRLNEAQIASMASGVATRNAVDAQDSRWEEMQAEATQVLVPDPFAAYGRELSEDAKTAIGYDPTTGSKSLQPARAMFVANQVRDALANKRMTLDEMRLSSTGPTQLSVHNIGSEGYLLFKPPAVRPPDSMTTAPTTATSAP